MARPCSSTTQIARPHAPVRADNTAAGAPAAKRRCAEHVCARGRGWNAHRTRVRLGNARPRTPVSREDSPAAISRTAAVRVCARRCRGRGTPSRLAAHAVARSRAIRASESSSLSRCRPHSFFTAASHHHRPARSCSCGATARVHGSQPMLTNPRSWSSL